MTTTASTAELGLGYTIADVLDDYSLSLHAAGKSKATRTLYRLTIEYLDAYLDAQGMPRHLAGIRREHGGPGWSPCAMRVARRQP